MTHEPPSEQIRMILALRKRREQRAQAALHRGLVEHATAAEEARQMDRALCLQTSARVARERQLYAEMQGQSFSARELARVNAEFWLLGRQVDGLAAQLAASMRIAETTHNEVKALRRQLGVLHRARRKWDELLRLADGRSKAHEVLLEELSTTDGSMARPRS